MLGVDLSIRDIFQAPTIATLTENLTTVNSSDGPKRSRPVLRRRTAAAESPPAHEAASHEAAPIGARSHEAASHECPFQ